MRILLFGNPNVGKSVVFSCLTGTLVTSANYPGSTVEFTHGWMDLNNHRVEVVDVPGIYSLDPTCETEQVAKAMLSKGDLILNVVDATNLERNLYLTLQLIEQGLPVVVALNIWDDAQHRGITIDVPKLEELLGVPVVPTSAVLSQGIRELIARLPEARQGVINPQTPDERWVAVGRIVSKVQTIRHRHHTWLESLEDASVRPVSGMLIAAAVVFLAFKIIRFIGEGLITYVLDPVFSQWYTPAVQFLSSLLQEHPFWHQILIGNFDPSTADFGMAMGVLTTGLYVPLAMVFPYILAFYLVLGFLEDLGFLPRLAVLLDSMMHSLGLHGYAIIPMILGLGCNVPAALSIRSLESRRQKFIATTLMATAIPCFAQTAVILALVGRHGGIYLAYVFITLLVVWLVLGLILNRFVQGNTPSLLIEIPPYRLPRLGAFSQKLGMRLREYLFEALPSVLIGILIVNLLFSLHIIDRAAAFFEPIMKGLFGLPKESLAALVLGFLRKDVALTLLQPLGLSVEQLVVAAVLLTVYFPCIATFVVLLRNLGGRDMLRATGVMFVTAALAGGGVNLALSIAPWALWLVLAAALTVALLINRSRALGAIRSPFDVP